MKRLTIPLLGAMLLCTNVLFAQQPQIGCTTDEVTKEYINSNPNYEKENALYEAFIEQFIEKMNTDKDFLKQKSLLQVNILSLLFSCFPSKWS